MAVGLTYIGLTLLFSGPFGLHIQLSIPAGYAIAVVLHFALQRFFVFADRGEFELSGREQAGKYVVLAGVQYVITALATEILPGALGLDERAVYVGSALAASAGVFLFLRAHVFHPADDAVG